MNNTEWLDTKYLNMISSRLRNFKRKNNNTYQMSCPVCGDSKKDKRKARGFIYNQKGRLRFYCHNCNVPGYDVPKLVKLLDPNLYGEYLKEKLADNPLPKTDVQLFADKMKTPVFQKDSPLKYLKKISSFKPDSPIKQWVINRQIPPEFHYKLYYCPKFMHWVNDHCIEDKFEQKALKHDEPRLIIPFLDEEKNLFGFQGRSFKPDSDMRYITIMLDEKPKIFGLDTLNRDKSIYVVEGPLDSTFIPNCIASAGSDLVTNLSSIHDDKSKFVVIYDNEPRNKEIVAKVDKAINAGFRVVIWPEMLADKDINDMVLAHHWSKDQLVDVIDSNTLSGLPARIKFSQWKKI